MRPPPPLPLVPTRPPLRGVGGNQAIGTGEIILLALAGGGRGCGGGEEVVGCWGVAGMAQRWVAGGEGVGFGVAGDGVRMGLGGSCRGGEEGAGGEVGGFRVGVLVVVGRGGRHCW